MTHVRHAKSIPLLSAVMRRNGYNLVRDDNRILSEGVRKLQCEGGIGRGSAKPPASREREQAAASAELCPGG